MHGRIIVLSCTRVPAQIGRNEQGLPVASPAPASANAVADGRGVPAAAPDQASAPSTILRARTGVHEDQGELSQSAATDAVVKTGPAQVQDDTIGTASPQVQDDEVAGQTAENQSWALLKNFWKKKTRQADAGPDYEAAPATPRDV